MPLTPPSRPVETASFRRNRRQELARRPTVIIQPSCNLWDNETPQRLSLTLAQKPRKTRENRRLYTRFQIPPRKKVLPVPVPVASALG